MEESHTEQTFTNDTNTPSNHTIEVLKAAIPYIDTRSQNTMNTALKAAEFVATIQKVQSPAELSAASLESKSTDTEGMLQSIKDVCNERERDMIDNLLNLVKVRKMYQTYNTFMHSKEGANLKNMYKDNPNFSSGDNTNMMDMMKSMLPPEQSSMIEAMSMMMQTMT